MRIPKIIHQSFSTKNMPKEILDNIKKIKKLNPNWEYRFYNDKDVTNFISENYESHILEYYNKINPKYGAARADLFRYLLIYKVGGVWLDKGEWELLKSENLAGSLNAVLTAHWQRNIRINSTKENFAEIYQDKFGQETYKKVKELREWLYQQPNKADLRAYILAEDPYSAEK